MKTGAPTVTGRNTPRKRTITADSSSTADKHILVVDFEIVGYLSSKKTAGAENGSQRVQTLADSPRPTRIVFAGERLSVRLHPTVSDC
jgi:hypothetical protein